MADGVVMVGGVFPSGAVVELVQVADERALRSEGGVVVGLRVVDGEGLVGFDGLELGARFFVCGYANGRRVEMRAVARTTADVMMRQPPVLPEPVVVGLTNTTVADPAPESPVDLPVGAAVGVGLMAAATDIPPSTTPVIEPAPSEGAPSEALLTATDIPVTTTALPDAPAPSAGAPLGGMSSPAVVLLLVQAGELGVPDAASLGEGQLRAAIREKNATPVA